MAELLVVPRRMRLHEETTLENNCSRCPGKGRLLKSTIKILLSGLRVKKGSEVKITQSCLTLCDPMDYTVHGIL